MNEVFMESKCATCGKVFIKAPEHALVDGTKAYCKPTCFLHRHDNKKKGCGVGRKAKRVAKVNDDGEIIEVYDSAKAVSETLPNHDVKGIQNGIRRCVKYRGYRWKYLD